MDSITGEKQSSADDVCSEFVFLVCLCWVVVWMARRESIKKQNKPFFGLCGKGD
jgi:hypothetical protein